MTITRAGLIARLTLAPALAALEDAAAWLDAHGCTPVIETASAAAAKVEGRWPTAPRDRIAHDSQVVIVFGGDGSLLDAAGAVAHSNADTPVMGVNLGRLGFLTEVGRADMHAALAALVGGRATIETRLMLEGRVVRGGRAVTERLALNDIVITRGALSRMTEIHVSVDGQRVCHVKADGLILATATGSTAYNLSAGGPIVHPAVDAIVMTPIAPHTLTNRPLVLPATSRVELRPEVDPRADIVATFDGQFGVSLESGDVVLIARSSRVLKLAHTAGRSHFDMLREKLQWGK